MMKATFSIQYAGQEYLEKYIIEQIKEIWVNSGHKVKDIDTLNVYCKPEERMFYYVINNTETGSLPM